MPSTPIFVETDHETAEDAGTTAAFFQTSTTELQRIAELDGSAKDVAAYLVLCGGVNERRNLRFTTHGALSVSKRTGIGYRDAANSIAWLAEHEFIYVPPGLADEDPPQRLSRKNQVQWVITDEAPDVGISKQFLEGVRKGVKTPLVAFFEKVRGGDDISTVEAGVDALVLFAVLMRELDFGAWGGVNPLAWSNTFVPVADDEDGSLPPAELAIEGTDQVLMTIQEGESDYARCAVMNEALKYVKDDSRRRSRFWHALHQLRQAQLLYRALVLWKGDPLGTDRPRHAEPQATLYINDGWARQIDEQIQDEVNRAAWRLVLDYKESEFDKEGQINEALAERYRFIVKSGTQGQYVVLGQLRVRFWPASGPMVAGREVDRGRTRAWARSAKNLKLR